MGKSPGKWIRRVIFGKKSSKSSSQKKTAILEKEEAAAEAATAAAPNTLLFGNTGSGEKPDNGSTVNLADKIPPCSLPQKQNSDLGKSSFLHSPSDSSNTITEQQEQAVTTAQAIFRSYLARRSEGAIKGIVRLQALTRGHLVRRRGVATLRCVAGIVRLQALFRGRRVRVSDIGREVQKTHATSDRPRVELPGSHATGWPDKLSSNAFISRLLASSPTALSLHINCDTTEPNGTWQWLERWSSSKFWEPLPQPKNVVDKKAFNKKGNIQTQKAELGRQKRVEGNNRKLLSDQSPAYYNKTNNIRKLEAKEELAGQEQPKNELERVKQNLRRISASSKEILASSAAEMPKLIPKMVSSSPTSEVLDKSVDKSIEETIDPPVAVSKNSVHNREEMASKTIAPEDKLYDDHVAVEKHPLECVEKLEDVPRKDEVRIYKEDKTSIDFEVGSNKGSLPGKLESPDFVSQKGLSLPNYMTATESAKAKLRGFSATRLDQDEVESVVLPRRHSLPVSTGSKLSLISPQKERQLAQASPRGESKSPLSSTNGHGRGARPGWRR